MLPNVEVQLKWPPKEYQSQPTIATSGEQYDFMSLKMESDHGLICTLDGSAVAVLSSHLFQIIKSCMKNPDFHTNVWVRPEEWSTQLAKVSHSWGKKKLIRMEVDLIFFGSEDDGASVAKDFGDSHAFLQEPHEGLTLFPYANPQSLDLPILPCVNEPLPLPATLQALGNSEDDEEMEGTEEADSKQMANLIGALEEFLEGLQTQRTMTTLVSKNSMMLSPLFSYQPIITGAKGRLPEEVLGGILADDMGLGKTLSMLSAIFTTMDHAQAYASDELGTKRSGTKSKATIVIVPSELLMNTWSREIE
ncbi:hypothetical protein IL306_010487, partial [Fusarium sp. DS 682]